jgi:hypothetical protein
MARTVVLVAVLVVCMLALFHAASAAGKNSILFFNEDLLVDKKLEILGNCKR